MPKFIALTSPGLGPSLEKEFDTLKLKKIKSQRTNVYFESNWKNLYRANLSLRTATRILMPILDFDAYNPEELYHNIKKHDFTKYIGPHQTLSVVAKVENDKNFNNEMFVAQKVKDAIVDQFQEKFGERPSVDKRSPDLPLRVRLKNTSFNVSIDTSGRNLSRRGYRFEGGDAPLAEHLAAGLMSEVGWKGDVPLVDPMCGSGTFLIEGVLSALDISPGSFNKSFAFQKWKVFQEEAWKTVLEESNSLSDYAELVKEKARKVNLSPVIGFDNNPDMVKAAQNNIKRAGLESYIHIEYGALKDFSQEKVNNIITNDFGEELKTKSDDRQDKNPIGIIVANPPYGDRLDKQDRAKKAYEQLGERLKSEFNGWESWIISGNEELSRALKLKSSRSINFDHGGLKCRWLSYRT